MYTPELKRYSRESKDLYLELRRQAFHVIGLLFWIIPINLLPELLTLLLFVVVLSVNTAVVFKVEPFYRFFSIFIELFERERNINRPAVQALYANLGIFFSFLIFRELATVGIVVLAIGDAFSTLAGKLLGRNPIFWNSSKTYEGSIAFLLSTYFALLLFMSPQ